MRLVRSALLLLPCLVVFPAVSTGAAEAQQDQLGGNCVVCHGVLGDERLSAPAKKFPDDIHATKGLGCVACHGGDATAPGLAGMDPALGFLGRPASRDVAQLCGRCHSDAQFMKRYNPSLRVDQVTEYVTSVHGRRLMELADTNVATCVSCHPAHSIRPPSDALSSVHPLRVAATCSSCHADAGHMQSYGIPTDQLSKYQRSVHWEMLSDEADLSAPTCNDCHGNHGATPPGISWVGNVCGQCHAIMADRFAQSVHARVFALLGVPGCAACHGNHEVTRAVDTLLGLGDGAVCAKCHAAGDRGGATAVAMRGLIDSLNTAFDTANAVLHQAEQAGMEVSNAQFELGGAQNALVQARAAVHAFVIDSVRAHVDEGLRITAEAHDRGRRALRELQFRRTGLGVSVAIILVLIAGLVFKIRHVEGRA